MPHGYFLTSHEGIVSSSCLLMYSGVTCNCLKSVGSPHVFWAARVEVGAEYARSAGLMVCMVDDKVWCDESFELKDFVYLKFALCGEKLFVMMPLLV